MHSVRFDYYNQTNMGKNRQANINITKNAWALLGGNLNLKASSHEMYHFITHNLFKKDWRQLFHDICLLDTTLTTESIELCVTTILFFF